MKKVIAGCIDLMLEFDSASELDHYIADIEAKKQEYSIVERKELPGDRIMIRIHRQYNKSPFLTQKVVRTIHKGLTKLQTAMWNDQEECKYCLKLDARHYYQSINHDLLKEKYSRMFNDDELLWLLNEIIDSIETAEIEDLSAIYLLEEDIDPETGIPIGNYLSQYSGNYYFSSFDHWIKEQKHVKYYFRYMDDIVIFGKTKEELIALKKEIDIYFRNELKLNIKGNWQVFPSYIRGVDFLGYRTFYKYTLLRKSTCLEMEKKMTAIRNKVEAGNMMNYSEWCSINSYKGWLKYADTFRLYQKYVVPLLPYADDYYIRNIKPNTKKGLNAA